MHKSCMSYFPLWIFLQLNLAGNQLCGLDRYGHGTYTSEGITAVANALRVNGSLTKIGEGGLDLRGNSIGEEGWAAIIGAVCSSTVSKISTIDASNKGIGAAGAKLIAESLKTSVNGSITKVW